MKLVKQPLGSGCCLAACLAMVTDKTLEYVLANASLSYCDEYDLEYLPLTEAIHYLADHCMTMGVSITPQSKMFEGIQEFNAVIQVDNADSILTVPSNNLEGARHCIVYSGGEIYDPYPINQVKTLEELEVFEWWLIQRIEEL